MQVRSGLVSNPPGGTTPQLPVAINRAMDPNLKDPRIMNWTVGVQQALDAATVLEVNYVGAAGRRMTYLQNINQLPEGSIQANPGVNANALRPYPGYTDILRLANGGVYNYDSLQVQLQRRIKADGFLRVAYTWSKNLTDDYDFQYIPMDSYHIGRDYGPAPLNRPHVLVVSYSYPLPIWRTGDQWYKKALGGWAVTGITTYESGWPLNAYVNSDIAGIGSTPTAYVVVDGNTGGGYVQRADVIGDPYANTNRIQAINPAAFAVPPFGRYGNAGAYAFRGARISNWNFTADWITGGWSERDRQLMVKYLDSGKGLVVLHHAVGTNNDQWPWWSENVTGCMLWNPNVPGMKTQARLKQFPRQTLRPVGDHPIVRGLQPFEIPWDETFPNMWLSPKITPLIESDDPSFVQPTVGWVGLYPKSRVVCFSPGHTRFVWADPMFRKVVHNMILWSGGRLS